MQRTTGEVAKRRLDTAIRHARATIAGEPLDAYERVLAAAWTRSDLLSRRCGSGAAVNVALVAFAMKSAHFMRDPESFVQTGRSPHAVLAELAEHLFAAYPMPKAMTSAWLEGDIGEARPAHDWYVRLGRGESLRRIGIPMVLTRAMAHLFTNAPCHLGVIAALRWAEVRALGGSDALAAAIAATRLGSVLDREDVHRELVALFVRSDVDLEHVGPIVDYVRAIKIETREGFRADGAHAALPPPEPDFELRGRTVASLLRRADAWHVSLGRTPVRDTTWRGAGYRPLRSVERVERKGDVDREREEVRVFTITEVLSSHELVREGRAMHHCVASYLGACLGGRSSIWSLRVETHEGIRRLLTIEVDPRTKTVVQARRRCNARAGERERALLVRWADEAGITVPQRAIL